MGVNKLGSREQGAKKAREHGSRKTIEFREQRGYFLREPGAREPQLRAPLIYKNGTGEIFSVQNPRPFCTTYVGPASVVFLVMFTTNK